MYQQLWGYKVEEKLYLGVREQKRLNTTALKYSHGHGKISSTHQQRRKLEKLWMTMIRILYLNKVSQVMKKTFQNHQMSGQQWFSKRGGHIQQRKLYFHSASRISDGKYSITSPHRRNWRCPEEHSSYIKGEAEDSH
jgi:hypothetical protein